MTILEIDHTYLSAFLAAHGERATFAGGVLWYEDPEEGPQDMTYCVSRDWIDEHEMDVSEAVALRYWPAHEIETTELN